ncbi:MAG: ABC transporter permease [Methylotetracoccus sp.]|nr:ABC transporter permease [Methylotetracoccus sp.]
MQVVWPFLKLIFRNLARQKLRNLLTGLGLVVAISSFGLLRTVVDAWYAGAEATSANRLITRNAISLVFSLPIAYLQRIRQVEGVTGVSYANWFAGIYIDQKNFFPQFAVEPESYLAMYPEYLLSDEERSAFLHDRQGVIAGRKVADQFGWKVGDTIPIRGTIYSGTFSFVLRGIYRGIDRKTDETQFFLHWQYLNERLKNDQPARAEQVGIFIVEIDRPTRAAEISLAIDRLFQNSLAETLTETEKAFQLSFVAMTEAILIAIELVSFVVIFIIMAVMANTIAMSVRERKREYATLRALGFGPSYVVALILGESVMIAMIGGVVGVAITFPAAAKFGARFGSLFPVFAVSDETVVLSVWASLLVGCAAAVLPAWRALRTPVSEGLKSLG